MIMINQKTSVLLFYFVISFLSINIASAQQQTLKGKVVNKDKLPVEFVHATLLKNDTVFVERIATDSLGTFLFKAEKGNYRLILEQFGTEYFNQHLVLNQDIDLGEIEIDESVILEEIVVSSYRKLIKREVDRLVFDVGNSPHHEGTNLTEILKITPGVSVVNNNVSIIGKSETQIMINNRLTTIPSGGLTNFLNSISSDDIKTIEVITNPPSQYDSEGNYGLINIIYKKRENLWSSRLHSAYTQTTYSAISGGGNLAYYKNNLSITLDINGKKGYEGVRESSIIEYPSQLWNGITTRKDRKDYLSSRLSLQYDATDKITIGGQYVGGIATPNIKDNSRTQITNTFSELDSLVLAGGNNIRENFNHSLNAFTIIKMDTLGRTLNIDLDYLKFDEKQNRDFHTRTILADGNEGDNFSISNNYSHQDINIYSIKADFVHPIKQFSINYGGKISYIDNNNSISFTDLTTGTPISGLNQSDRFQYKENTQSLYFSIAHKLNSVWNFKAGMRYENTNTEGVSITLNQTNKNHYYKFFPSLYTTYTPNNNNTYSFSYGKRIQRPRFWEINPFRWYVNDYYYSEGNPFLQPAFVDNFELNHIYKGVLTTILFMSITDNGFGQMPLIDPNTNVVTLTRQNYFKKYNYGIGVVYQYQKSTWFNSFLHTQVYYSDTEFNNDIDESLIGNEQNGFTYTLTNNNSFILNKSKTLFADLSLWYSSPNNSGLHRQESRYSASLGVRALFMDKKLQIAANVYDIFKTSNPDIITTYNGGLRRIANVYNDNRYFNLSVSYNFGNQKIRSVKRQGGNDEESRRL
ncbi:TonB-dependent receptor [Paenimyroides tangerinum]|uniref:TonB-dependent receptor n=2 Tax=Paenimyroides tangerinum TaxID=2488728 RepID=A0A3P3WB13_9FLAO|nr:TonB-dependent receptor [Paenimyroides tangerinum]